MNMEINPSEYKILIVDDVMSNVLLLKVLLTNEKFMIATASNGGQALEQVEKEKPDLVLLDVMMPDLSGFEVAQRLKSNPETAEIPIIFLTALNSTADIVKGFQVGANDFISKPFNKEELIIRVTHQISLVAAKRIILAKTEELQRTIAGRDKLYSVIAHDLRSPMGSIKMVLNMLILNLPAEKIGTEMYELLTMANQTTEDVFALLDNLLKWTKSQIGKLNVVYQDIDLVEVVDGVVEIFNMVAGLKKITIKEEKAGRMLVHGDIDMLKTIVRNLMSNAIKFSNEGTEIVVKMQVQDNMAVVSVQDHGCGIDEEGQKKLLHTDTHFSTFGTKNEEGSGLGLLLCQDFIVKNGGKLWFTSKKGEGSIFYFSVPLKEE
ncbi:MAG: response regulator [Bacteroides sp.]|nr:response regulator [Bacteroides sp.]